jgi:monovalent cation:proton antiporter-2 (CPA2) family protein
MYGERFFIQAFIYLSAAVISVPIAKRLGLGSVLGYLLAGMIIGPFGIGLIGSEGLDVMHFAEFGVVMMLFLVGLELDPSLLWRMRRGILGLGGMQVGLTAVAGTTGLMLFGMKWQYAVLIAFSLSLSSTALILQTLYEKDLFKSNAGQSTFSVLMFQDISVIPMLAFLPLLATLPVVASYEAHDSHSWVEGMPASFQAIIILLSITAIILAGRYLTRPIFRFIARARLREIFTATALLLVIGIALLMSKIGLSPALGTFLAGVVLANSEYRHALEADIDPFKGLLLGVFFIAIGASLDFNIVISDPARILTFVIILIVAKMIILFILGRLFNMGLDQNLIFTVALAQGGEFAFVLISFALQNGALPVQIGSQVIAVVALSMAVTPMLMILNEKVILPRFGTLEDTERAADLIKEENPVIIAGFRNFGSIVGRFLFANKVKATVLEYDSDHVETLRKLGFKVFYGDASRVDLLKAAGAEKAKFIIITVGDPEKTIEIVKAVQDNFPHLEILARAIGRSHAYELMDLNVDHIYREKFDASLKMGVDALRLLGYRAHQARRASMMFMRHDEEMLAELAKHRHDRGTYLSRAKQAIYNLEQLLRMDLEDKGEDQDIGWDTTSMRDELQSTLPKLNESDNEQ